MGVPDQRYTPGMALVNVRSNIRSFSVTPSQETITAGDGIILEAEAVGADGTLLDASDVSWSSSNPDIAYVTQETGQWTSVEGLKAGTVIITGKYQYECETMLTTATITVKPSFAGEWDFVLKFLNVVPMPGLMVLTVNGTNGTGTYQIVGYGEMLVNGQILGGGYVLTGTLSSGAPFEITLSPDGNSFTGWVQDTCTMCDEDGNCFTEPCGPPESLNGVRR